MYQFITLIVVVFGILQIILFFKLWGMTNDVKAIKLKLCSNEQNKQPTKPQKPINSGDKVFCKSRGKEGIYRGKTNGQAFIEFKDGSQICTGLYDIEAIN